MQNWPGEGLQAGGAASGGLLPELSAIAPPPSSPTTLGVTGKENKPGFRAGQPWHETQLCPS